MKRRFLDIQRLLILPIVFMLTTAFLFGRDAEDEYEKGLKAYQSDDYMQALQYLDQTLRKDPDYTLAKDLRPWVQLKLNRVGEAETYFEGAYEQDPRDINAVEGMAWVRYLQGEFQEARAFFEKQAALASEHILNKYFSRYTPSDRKYILSVRSDAHYGLALIAQNQGDRASAILFLEKALEDPNVFMPLRFILVPLVEYYFEDEAYEQAADLLERTLRKQRKPDYALMIKAGWANYRADDVEKAERIFQSSLKLRREAPEGLYGLAWCAHSQGRQEELKSFLTRSIAMDPYIADGPDVRELIEEHPSALFSLWKDFGLSYYRLGNYTAARDKLKIYLEKQPDDPESLLAMGWSCRWSGALEDAEDAFKRLVGMEESRSRYYVGLGSVYLAKGDLEAAKAALELALAVNNLDPNAMNGLAHYWLSRGEKQKARWLFRKAVRIDPENDDSLHQLATMFYQEKQYEKAIPYYQELIKHNPKAAAPHNMLGWCHYYLKRYDDSERAFLRSKSLHPDFADCYYGLGLLYAERGAYKQAEQELGRAIDIAPAYVHTDELETLMASQEELRLLFERLGWSYYRFQAYHKALQAFEQFQGQDPETRLSSIRGQAWCHYRLGRYGKAYDLFNRILEQDPGDSDARMGMGLVLFHKKEYIESMEILKAVVEEKPRQEDCWRTMAAIHEIQGEPEKAERIYAHMKEMAPAPKEIHNEKGWNLYAEGRYNEAIEAFNRSVAANPQLGAPNYGLGLSHLHLDRKQEAKESLSKGITLQPGYMDTPRFYRVLESDAQLLGLRSDLGWSYFYKQRYDDALFHFEEMLEQKPDHKKAIVGKGTVLYTRGDYQGAIDHYSELMEQVPDHSEEWDQWSYMLNNWGWGLFFQEKYPQAATLFQRLEAYHRDLPVVAPLNGLGWCALKMGDPEKARNLFLRSLWVLPGNYLAQLGMNLLEPGQGGETGETPSGPVSAN